MKKSKKNHADLIKCIFYTFICLGPFGNLLFSILTHSYENILISAVATFFGAIIIGVIWCFYVVFCTNVGDKMRHFVEQWAERYIQKLQNKNNKKDKLN